MIHPSIVAEAVPHAPGLKFGYSPLLVFYEVTRACDLVCQACRAGAQTQSHPSELTTEESLRLIDQLTDFPTPPMLVLTGGDPMKRSDIFELVEHAAWSGLDVSITPCATPHVTTTAPRRLAVVQPSGRRCFLRRGDKKCLFDALLPCVLALRSAPWPMTARTRPSTA